MLLFQIYDYWLKHRYLVSLPIFTSVSSLNMSNLSILLLYIVKNVQTMRLNIKIRTWHLGLADFDTIFLSMIMQPLNLVELIHKANKIVFWVFLQLVTNNLSTYSIYVKSCILNSCWPMTSSRTSPDLWFHYHLSMWCCPGRHLPQSTDESLEATRCCRLSTPASSTQWS